MSDETSVSEEESKGEKVIYLILFILPIVYIASIAESPSGTVFVILLIVADYSIIKQDKRVIPRWIMIATTIVYFAYYYIFLISGITYLLDFQYIIVTLYLILYSEYFTRYILKNEDTVLLDQKIPISIAIIGVFILTFGYLLLLLWANYVNFSDEFHISVSFLDYLLTPYILSIYLSFAIFWMYDINAIMRIMSRVEYTKPVS